MKPRRFITALTRTRHLSNAIKQITYNKNKKSVENIIIN
jgi:hypothetical protein